ncbi:MAG: exonuclease subunit SbcD [Candidatus Riflebacteria bacterium]|nr:exonuclease subunit SbcD [Candidatus Riflebacteria bacterium]
MFRILHTSDWHIGHLFYGKRRIDEFESFFAFLLETVKTTSPDALIVSGDVFDSPIVSNAAQEQYYSLLSALAETSCKNIIITAGNHDSPSFLEAPSSILKRLNVHISARGDSLQTKEPLLLKDSEGKPACVVCAVPYLRERDVRRVEDGESPDEKAAKYCEGILNFYTEVCSEALKLKQEYKIPLVVTGHLFASGGKTLDDDGRRDIFVGKLVNINAEHFPSYIDYLALGHLHMPQKINAKISARYSGSPLPMGFSEASQQKQLVLADFKEGTTELSFIDIPVFQRLERPEGSLKELIDLLEQLKESKKSVWLEVTVTSDESPTEIKQTLEKAVAESQLEILIIKRDAPTLSIEKRLKTTSDIKRITPPAVFAELLKKNDFDEEKKELLTSLFNEALTAVQEEIAQ